MEFEIQVFRPTAMPPSGVFNQGFLKFEHGDVRINTPCWWDKKRVLPGAYIATATRMDNRLDGRTPDGNGVRKREAIWLKRKVQFPSYIPYGPSPMVALPLKSDNGETTATGVFIHKGSQPSHSDACVVADENLVFTIWDLIPKNEDNILVHIYDYEPVMGSGSIPTM